MTVKMIGVEPTLKTTDLDRCIRFYQHVLGFSLVTTWPAGNPRFCILARDNVRIMFYQDDSLKRPLNPSLPGQLRLDMKGVQEMYDEIREEVVTEWGPEVYDYGRREVSIRDCNGYSLILTEATNDPPTCIVD